MPAKEPLSAREQRAAEHPNTDGRGAHRPLLMVDIDGVISLFGVSVLAGADPRPAEGSFHSIEGIPHFLSATAAAHLLDLHALFELVWASGWEERANDHLPHLLGLPAGLPFLRFSRITGPIPARANAHWKLDAIEAHAAGRALAWIDDALDEECRAWADARSAPTLLVQTEPDRGLTLHEAQLLTDWALALPSS
jgi:HAD domain in Swiss Army Knife RNA repair proteins